MALSFTTTLRNNRADQITAAVGSSGKIRIYDGTPPANVGTALSGNVQVAELPCSSTFASASSGGVLTVNTITNDASADASSTGPATFFRVLTAGNTAVIQGTVSVSGGGGDLQLNTTNIVAAAIVSITSFVITEGNP